MSSRLYEWVVAQCRACRQRNPRSKLGEVHWPAASSAAVGSAVREMKGRRL